MSKRRTVRRRAKRARATKVAHRPNPPSGARLFGRGVTVLGYWHTKDNRHGRPLKHEFGENDTLLYALPDGSVLLKAQSTPIWRDHR